MTTRDERLALEAADWTRPGRIPLLRTARHALAVPIGQARWTARLVTGGVRSPKAIMSGWLREQLAVLGPSAAEVARLLEQAGGMAPAPLVEEFRDRPVVPDPLTADTVWAILRRSFPGRVASLDCEPLAVSPLSQLHRAVLDDGTQALFRVARPGVRAQLEADIRLAATLLIPAQLVPPFNHANPLGVLRSAARQAVEHTDLRNDALNTAELAAAVPKVAVAEPLDGLSSPDAVGFAAVPGAVPLARALGRVDRRKAAAALQAVTVEAALADGIFHADLRSEHLFVLEDGSLLIVGCSALGRLGTATRRAVLDYVTALFGGDHPGQVDALGRLGVLSPGTDTAALLDDLRAAPELSPKALFTGGDAAGKVLGSLAVRHGFQAPVEIVQWFRALLTFRAVTHHVAPAMPLAQALFPLIPRLAEINGRLGNPRS
ncbi:AarF/UbiB family protein [Actinocorallia longicatena]|uniref:ABC1 atypical kinase-like domain-containing protein n=1 Tax=Actinocorallia longicatena TaxID=111803 RepID=A0ABP6QLX5_9ACTN